MEGWMYQWMNEYIDWLIDEWIDGLMNRFIDGWMNVSTNEDACLMINRWIDR